MRSNVIYNIIEAISSDKLCGFISDVYICNPPETTIE